MRLLSAPLLEGGSGNVEVEGVIGALEVEPRTVLPSDSEVLKELRSLRSVNLHIPHAAEFIYYLNVVENMTFQRTVTKSMLLDVVEQALRERLPSGWNVRIFRQGELSSFGIDVMLDISGPKGDSLRVAIEVKQLIEPRDVPSLWEKLNPSRSDGFWDTGLIVARYLSSTVRARLIETGLSFVDATGNIYIRSDALPLYISDRGLDRDPWRGPGRPKGTLKGAPSAQVVRTLLDAPGPWKMRELIAAAEAATGSVYRVVEFLESEGLLLRDRKEATVVAPEWVSVLRRWSADYEFLRTNVVSSWIAPRGIESVIRLAIDTDLGEYVMTGSIAAETWAPYAPVRSVMAYSPNVLKLAEQWGLRKTDVGANVLLAEPAYSALTRGARRRSDGLMIAAPIQVAADLLTGPGRAPSEAEELIDWMVENESEWR